MIRPVIEEDIPWLHKTCEKVYPAGYYDQIASEKFIRMMIGFPNGLMLRGTRSWLGVTVSSPWWNPRELEARFLPIVSTEASAAFELVRMVKKAIDWSRDKGAKKFYFVAVTGIDLGPLARRFGAVPVSPSYVLDLSDVRCSEH